MYAPWRYRNITLLETKSTSAHIAQALAEAVSTTQTRGPQGSAAMALDFLRSCAAPMASQFTWNYPHLILIAPIRFIRSNVCATSPDFLVLGRATASAARPSQRPWKRTRLSMSRCTNRSVSLKAQRRKRQSWPGGTRARCFLAAFSFLQKPVICEEDKERNDFGWLCSDGVGSGSFYMPVVLTDVS